MPRHGIRFCLVSIKKQLPAITGPDARGAGVHGGHFTAGQHLQVIGGKRGRAQLFGMPLELFDLLTRFNRPQPGATIIAAGQNFAAIPEKRSAKAAGG